MKRAECLFLCGALVCMLFGCSQNEPPTVTEDIVEFEQLTPMESEPIIIREEQPSVVESAAEAETATTVEEEEMEPWVDRMAGEQETAYSVDTQVYEEGIVKLTYPQLSGMQNTELQERLNENIKHTLLQGSADERLTAYEYRYETASMGAGVVSFVFRGYINYEDSPYPINAVKTLNLNLITGESVRLKDYADVATVVSALETSWGYEVVSEGVQKDDFSAFMNNGYVTDYAMTLLDYDMDFKDLAFVPAGFSCIRDNHLVLLIETEHAMGDYVEIIFDEEL